jgi:hypothetical protein
MWGRAFGAKRCHCDSYVIERHHGKLGRRYASGELLDHFLQRFPQHDQWIFAIFE